nr:ribosomal protein S9 [Palmellopsis texensis]
MEILARAVGRRKEAVAQVQIVTGTGQFLINNKIAEEYLQNGTKSLIAIKAPFSCAGEVLKTNLFSGNNSSDVLLDQASTGYLTPKFDTIVKVRGGGLVGQADAIKLGIARAICDLVNSKKFKEQIPNSQAQELVSQNSLTDSPIPSSETSNVLENITTIRKELKTKGYLTQDSRVKERKKYGLKKARKAPQYHKR